MTDIEVPEGVLLFSTAEDAALASWAALPGAAARVVEIRPAADATAVWVVVQLGEEPTGFHDQDIVTCVQTPTGQWWTSGSTGSSSGVA